MTSVDILRSWIGRTEILWTRDPKGMSLDLLRVGMGLVWVLNLIFILTPSNQYFSMFQSMASGYGPSSLGGAGFADWVAGQPLMFAWAIALLTAYLAVAFLAGITTRLACVAGTIASVVFLVTQFYTTFALDGSGTDVGPHPLYILVYVILFAGGAGQYFALDHWMWASGKARFPRISRWVASPRDLPGNASSHPGSTVPPGAREGPTEESPVGYPFVLARAARRSFTRGAILGCLITAALLLVGVGLAIHFSPPATSTNSSAKMSISDIEVYVNYSGGATSGGLGSFQQSGCWSCVTHVEPGTSIIEVQMLTNNHSAAPVTVTSLVIAPPFALLSGPSLPHAVPVDKMWMFDLEIGTPDVPGNYTILITYSTQ